MLGPFGRRHGSVHICFKLLCFLNILMFVRHEFDSDGDFKGKVGDEDEAIGQIQNDELLTVQKCFIFLSKIEYLTVWKRHKKAKMSRNHGIYNV